MSPATVGYPLRDIKLLFVNDNEDKCTYWLKPVIYKGKIRLADIVRKFKPGLKIPDTRFYPKVYNHIKRLAALGYVTLQKQTTILTQETFDLQEKEQGDSVRAIFAAAVAKDTPPFISTEALSGEAKQEISTVKVTDPGFYVVPTANLFTLLSRVQNSNRFFDSAKCRREQGELRGSLEWLKMQRHRCPYYLSHRTRAARMEAVFRLRSIRKHGYFRRRDKRVVNPEMLTELRYVQTKFDQYLGDIEDLKCALVHKETGAIKLLDYQTRFTDEDRKKAVIAKYHDAWRIASENFNTGVFLTLTSFPPSEVSRHGHRSSLWHVDRHFSPAWNAYMSLLEKRNRMSRRDELLALKLIDVKKIREVHERTVKCPWCKGSGLIRPKRDNDRADPPACPECKGTGRRKEPVFTRDERKEALAPMKDEKFRPRYLHVYEFMENGMLHGHCLIFGKSWLASFERIKSDWIRLGQGERVHVYGVHKEMEAGKAVWKWSKGKPQDARNREPVDYLGKYLIKGVKESKSHGLYWAVNKRFFTNSRALQDAGPEIDPALEQLPAQYSFLGSFKGGEIPAWLEPKKPTFSGPSGIFDALGWSGSPGPGVPA